MTTDDEQQDLIALNVISATFIAEALQAGLVTFAAKRFFYGLHERKQARAHPGSCMVYAGLIALEEQRFVFVAEAAVQYFPEMRVSAPFRRGAELVAHRHAISHPTKSTWQREWMQEFHDAGRPHTDLRAGILWDHQRSLNELTVGSKFGAHNTELRVTVEMVAMLQMIMRHVVKPEDAHIVPSTELLSPTLLDMRPRYIEMLERYREGRDPNEPPDIVDLE